ncbi:MAG: carboxypeptidase-like regulatory domain-containing protein [Planctomycetota bacterium]
MRSLSAVLALLAFLAAGLWFLVRGGAEEGEFVPLAPPEARGLADPTRSASEGDALVAPAPPPRAERRPEIEPDAGVPVGIHFGGPWPEVGPLLTGAPGGEVTFLHLANIAAMAGAKSCSAVLAIPLAVPVAAPLDPVGLPPEPVVLRIPPTGRLEVLVLDPQGGPPPGGATVCALAIPTPEELRARAVWSPLSAGRVFLSPGGAALAVFPHVELGGRLEIIAGEPSADEGETVTIDGPVAPGETVRVEIRLAATVPVLVTRLLDPAGQPVVSTAFETSFETATGERVRPAAIPHLPLRTDAEGCRRGPTTGAEACLERRGRRSRLVPRRSTRVPKRRPSMRTASLVLVLALAIVLGIVVWRGEAGRPAGQSVAPSPARPPLADRPAVELVPVNPPPTATGGERTVAAEPTRPPAAARPLEGPLAEGREILVRRGTTEEPASGAEVRSVDEWTLRSAWDEDSMTLSVDGFELLLAEHARRFRADENGRVLVPTDACLVEGRVDELLGLVDASCDDSAPLLLRLFPQLSVRVVDEARTPQPGIPVGLRFGAEESHEYRGSVATQAPHGIAVLSYIGAMAWMEGGTSLRVGLAVPLPEPVEATLDAANPPIAPIELVLPAFGFLEVHLIRLEDEEPAKGIVVSLLLPRPPEEIEGDPLEEEFPEWRDSRRYQRFVAGLFAPGEDTRRLPVGLGLDLEVEARSPAGEEGVRRAVCGPSLAGGVVRVEIALEELEPVLVGRIVDEEGRPLAATRFAAKLRTVGSGYSGTSGTDVRTDGEGRFRYVLRGRRFVEGTRTLTLVPAIPPGAESTTEPREVRLDLSVVLPPGKRDVGDLVLAPVPLLVAGRVVDELGSALAEARVSLAIEDRPDERFPLRWIPAGGVEPTRTDGEGRFEIRGIPDREGPLGLQAEHELHATGETVRFPPGDREAVVVLARGGRIEGRILLDPEAPEVRVEAGAESADSDGRRSAIPDADGAFDVPSLRPGFYRVSVRLRRSDTIVREVPGVEVRPGEVTVDPRLAAVDLRGSLRRFVLAIVDPAGSPISDVWASHGAPGAGEEARGFASAREDGRVEIETHLPTVDIQLEAPGFRTTRLADVTSDQTVALLPAPAVRLVLADPAVVPGEGHALLVELLPTASLERSRSNPVAFDARGEALVWAPGTGPHRLQLLFTRSADVRSGRFSLSWPAAPTIDVAESDREQRFVLELPAAVVEAARNAFERKR